MEEPQRFVLGRGIEREADWSAHVAVDKDAQPMQQKFLDRDEPIEARLERDQRRDESLQSRGARVCHSSVASPQPQSPG